MAIECGYSVLTHPYVPIVLVTVLTLVIVVVFGCPSFVDVTVLTFVEHLPGAHL